MEWGEFVTDTKMLANQIKEDNFEPEILIAVARGGWFPTRFLSDYLKVKNIASIGIKYIDDERTQLYAYSHPSIPDNINKVLIIEDMLESGKSIKWAQKYYEELGYNVKIASIYITDKTPFSPDYFCKKIDISTRFPWES